MASNRWNGLSMASWRKWRNTVRRMWTLRAACTNSGAIMDMCIIIQSIPLKQMPVNLNALFTGHEQVLTLTREPIDLTTLLFRKASIVESLASDHNRAGFYS